MTKSDDILGSESNVEAYYATPKVEPKKLTQYAPYSLAELLENWIIDPFQSGSIPCFMSETK